MIPVKSNLKCDACQKLAEHNIVLVVCGRCEQNFCLACLDEHECEDKDKVLTNQKP